MTSGVPAGLYASFSLIPKRSWKRRSGPGAHQVRRPVSFITEGTRRLRTTIASMRTARATPSPSILVLVTREVPMATMTTARITAAAVIRPPVRRSPKRTECSWSPVASYSSLMRESRNTP
ncbi:hypothetical protein STANM309S_01264 [Streptomyces tanashiensis]